MREDIRGALADAQSLAELEQFAWPTPDLFDYSGLAAQCRRWDSHALLYGFADIWQRPALVRGWEGMFIDMVERPEWAQFLSASSPISIKRTTREPPKRRRDESICTWSSATWAARTGR